MKDINQLLTDLTKNFTHIISNPKTIEEMEERGVKFDIPIPKTEEEILNELFKQRRKQADTVLTKFPSAPQIAVPTMGFLYDEIRECIIFGLFGAAISLSAVLVEFALKHAIVRKKSGAAYDAAEWDRLENIEFGQTIKEAREQDIIDDELKTHLVSFKNTIRNPYLHYNIKRITKNVAANKVKRMDTTTLNVEEVDLAAKDNPVIWGFAKKFVDKEMVFDVFAFADKIVKNLFENKKI